MKRYIDLFTQQIKQNKYVLYLNKAKRLGTYLLYGLAALIVLEIAAYFYIMQQISAKDAIKKKYNTFIIQNQVFDSKINYFAFKYGLLKQNLATDANISYYYGLLDTFISEIRIDTTISEFSLNNEQVVQFSLSFNNYENAVAFMSRLESEKLPDYFNTLKLREFSIGAQTTDQYILEFEGTFKKVTDAT